MQPMRLRAGRRTSSSVPAGSLSKSFPWVVPGMEFWDTRSAMRRKPQPKFEPVVPAEILEKAKRSLSNDQLKKPMKCGVCGAEASSDPEQLCWVCRRLKISAWRDNEQQMPAQE